MAKFKCAECGCEKEGRCKPRKCPECGAGGKFEKVE
ncbi:MAG: RCKP-type rubredoxin-like domain-containing protein [Candidatus Hydrothermarchaeales archaeon]